MHVLHKILLGTSALALAAMAQAQAATIVTVTPPDGATATTVFGINDHGVIAGSYVDANGVELRLQKVKRLTPQPFTTLGWQVADICKVLARLTASRITPERYDGLDQDAAGIWQAPSGARVEATTRVA